MDKVTFKTSANLPMIQKIKQNYLYIGIT